MGDTARVCGDQDEPCGVSFVSNLLSVYSKSSQRKRPQIDPVHSRTVRSSRATATLLGEIVANCIDVPSHQVHKGSPFAVRITSAVKPDKLAVTLPREKGLLKEVGLSHGLANLVTNLINASTKSDDAEFEGVTLGMHGFQT